MPALCVWVYMCCLHHGTHAYGGGGGTRQGSRGVGILIVGEREGERESFSSHMPEGGRKDCFPDWREQQPPNQNPLPPHTVPRVSCVELLTSHPHGVELPT